jgi:hypothetical protein
VVDLMTQRAISDWQKGGLRYAKLKKTVPEFLAPVRVDAFFVAVRRRGGRFRLFNPLTPFQREYVIAATNDGVFVLKLRRPGVFRASISGICLRGAADRLQASLEDGKVVLGSTSYQPIAFHQPDAERVVELLRASRTS